MAETVDLALTAIQNGMLIAALALVTLMMRRASNYRATAGDQLVLGVVHGIFALIAARMAMAVFADTDSFDLIDVQVRLDLLIVLMAGLLIGVVGGIACVVVALGFEVFFVQGGMTLSGVIGPDVAAMAGVAVLGLAARRWWRPGAGGWMVILVLALVGAAAVIGARAIPLSVDPPLTSEDLARYAPYVFVAFLVGAAILAGPLLMDEKRRLREAELVVAERSRDEAANALIWAARDGKVLYVNATACELLGYTRDELLRRHLRDLDDSASDEESTQRRLQAPNIAWPRYFVAKMRDRNDSPISVEVAANRLDFPDGERDPIMVVSLRPLSGAVPRTYDAAPATSTVAPSPLGQTTLAKPASATTTPATLRRTGDPAWVGRSQTASEESEPEAETVVNDPALPVDIEPEPEPETDTVAMDPLTRLPDRAALDRNGRDMAQRAARRQVDNMVVAIVDIDDLDGFNARRGIAMGDALLQAYARILKQNMRREDSAYRYGGDEFACLMPGRGEGAFDYLRMRFEEIMEAVRAAGFPDAEATVGFAAVSEVNYDMQQALRVARERIAEEKAEAAYHGR